MRLYRKGRKKDIIIFGDNKIAKVLHMEPNLQTGIPDIYIKHGSPEFFFMFMIAGVAAIIGFTAFSWMGFVLGLMGGFFIPLALFAFFSVNVHPKPIRIPESAIAGLKSIASLKSGTRYPVSYTHLTLPTTPYV